MLGSWRRARIQTRASCPRSPGPTPTSVCSTCQDASCRDTLGVRKQWQKLRQEEMGSPTNIQGWTAFCVVPIKGTCQLLKNICITKSCFLLHMGTNGCLPENTNYCKININKRKNKTYVNGCRSAEVSHCSCSLENIFGTFVNTNY